MNTVKPTPEDILAQIAQIERMERGKLCILREGPSGPYFNCQRWERGRNVSEYVPSDQVPLIKENIESYARFEALLEQYIELLSERSRRQRLTGVKKKRPVQNSSWPKNKKSNH